MSHCKWDFRATRLVFDKQFSVGSLYKVKNKMWKKSTEFAKTDFDNGIHPGLIIELDKFSFGGTLIPGTSSWHKGSCKVFHVNLNRIKKSYFLFTFHMVLPAIDLEKLIEFTPSKMKDEDLDKCLVKWYYYCQNCKFSNDDC